MKKPPRWVLVVGWICASLGAGVNFDNAPLLALNAFLSGACAAAMILTWDRP